MSQPDETPALQSTSFDMSVQSNFGEPSNQASATPGPSIETCVDQDFDFQIVVFKVENTLFKVLRNGFNVPGTPFEAMFDLPQTQTDSSLEGNSLENPIHLPGVKADDFRCFLRILYPFIDPRPIRKFDEWAGVLSLANMWVFPEIRERAITQLSELVSKKKIMERIALAREYRVADWLRDAYLELAQKPSLDFKTLRPEEPISNPEDRDWEEEAKKWEAISRDWETLAKISHIQMKAVPTYSGVYGSCTHCGMYKYSSNCTNAGCRILIITAMVDETFRGELESLKENPDVEPPLPSNRARRAAPPKKRKRRKKA